jgi:DNA-binding PucR family transcriptional regulator
VHDSLHDPLRDSVRDSDEQPVARLRDVLLAAGRIGVSGLDALVAPAGLDVPVTGVGIFDPEDDPADAVDTVAAAGQPGDLVLVVGVRDRAAGAVVRAVGRRGVAAVAVKISDDRFAPALREAAADAGVALLAVRPGAAWEQLAALARGVVSSYGADGRWPGGEWPEDLFVLAQTIAAATGGIVSIEDPAAHVLAYSDSGDEVDELRRLSILGRQGPESYLKMLRTWGVYERLRAGDEVVEVDERPDLGIRRRLAVGVHAGQRYLGTVWVQEGAEPMLPGADRALVGAARVVALSLVRRRGESAARSALRDQLLQSLLEGRADASSVAEQVGADPAAPIAVVAFALRTDVRIAHRQSDLELRLARLAGLVAVHAAAYRRAALVTVFGDRTYVLLPDTSQSASLALAREIVTAARGLLGGPTRAAVGTVLPGFGHAAASRVAADRVLTVMTRDGVEGVATFDDVRPRVLVGEILELLNQHPEVRDDRLTALAAHDREHGADFVPSLLAYLDAHGDVAAAAAALHVHPNTLRYRLRRLRDLFALDLADPLQRLVASLQLRL